jgi:hypothetical protein
MTAESAEPGIAGPLARSVLSRASTLADTLVATIGEHNPGYETMAVVPPEDLWQSCHDNIARVLELVAGAPADEEHYDAARATGTRRAEQRMPLDGVLRSFRLGGRLVWEALIEQARREDTVDADALLDVATRVWEVVDETSAQVAASYHATQRRLLRAVEQRRATLWEGLLAGRGRESPFAHVAARVLGLPVDGPYAAVALDEHAGAGANVAAAREQLTGTGISSAWQARANVVVGLLALAEPALETALNALRGALGAPAGVSLVVHGLAEVETAYQQAVLARRTVAPGARDIAALRENLPEALIISAPDLADKLVDDWLGPLLELPVTECRLLLGTLQTWVASACSTTRTAQAAHCHRNTVVNRLRRIEEVTGHVLLGDTAPVELSLALRAARLLRQPTNP